MAHIAHLTSAHPRQDTRIFFKQCQSMVESGHQVTLIVADGKGDTDDNKIRILDVGLQPNRFIRMLHSSRNVFKRAVDIDADIYILHDPELIPHGIKLRKLNKKVIFDSHEDVPKQMLGKPYLGRLSAYFLSRSFQAYEQYACRRLDGIVTATQPIREKFKKINRKTIAINNYPIVKEFDNNCEWSDKAFEVCYVGNITASRGIRELVMACNLLRSPVKLVLAGAFESITLTHEVANLPGWQRVKALGHVNRICVHDVMKRSLAGLVTLHPKINYLDALPVKMFEYMAAGIPVIASDFPLWREIVESNSCGICVDPTNPMAISEAIDYVVSHPNQARRMGANGKRAVIEKYNWSSEALKMLDFYEYL